MLSTPSRRIPPSGSSDERFHVAWFWRAAPSIRAPLFLAIMKKFSDAPFQVFNVQGLQDQEDSSVCPTKKLCAFPIRGDDSAHGRGGADPNLLREVGAEILGHDPRSRRSIVRMSHSRLILIQVDPLRVFRMIVKANRWTRSARSGQAVGKVRNSSVASAWFLCWEWRGRAVWMNSRALVYTSSNRLS
jgi:hypothetical protein